jgi:hypothetical protein
MTDETLYGCINCGKELLRDKFVDFDNEMEVGTCAWCIKNPSYKHVIRTQKYGTPQQLAKLEKDLADYEKAKEIIYPKKPQESTGMIVSNGNSKELPIYSFVKNRVLNGKNKPNITYDLIKPIFWEIYKAVIFNETGVVINHTSISEDAGALIRNYLKWLILDESGEIPITKSIYLHGSFGVGKTTLIMAGLKFTEYLAVKVKYKDRLFKSISMDELFLESYTSESLKNIGKLVKGFWVLDEVMEKHLSYKHYGKEHMIINDILMARHNLWKRNGTPTMIISNMRPELFFTQSKDMRIISRLQQQYYPVEFKGVDFRTI